MVLGQLSQPSLYTPTLLIRKGLSVIFRLQRAYVLWVAQSEQVIPECQKHSPISRGSQSEEQRKKLKQLVVDRGLGYEKKADYFELTRAKLTQWNQTKEFWNWK